ncbi:alkaline phosphatase [Candidatus Geothermarchaeota archaeon ex4572_27]|nr:MAG: alkaline phosphatase [Candidatus Geothermarchaeota archaeon ex4572_27]
MSLAAAFVEYIAGLIEEMGYVGVFLLMVLESAGVPIPSEIVVTFSGFLAARGSFDFWTVVLVSTAANLAGSLLFYYVGYVCGEGFVERYGRYLRVTREHLDFVRSWFARYGDLTVFIGRVTPAVRTYISLPAGIAMMRLSRFVPLTVVGSTIWNYLLTLAGFWLGENWRDLLPYLDAAAAAVVACAVAALAYLRRRGWRI